tara:strand:- start:223 stop:462 length:240 start_codon:yes stop_codon:yes gene_type:complete
VRTLRQVAARKAQAKAIAKIANAKASLVNPTIEDEVNAVAEARAEAQAEGEAEALEEGKAAVDSEEVYIQRTIFLMRLC